MTQVVLDPFKGLEMSRPKVSAERRKQLLTIPERRDNRPEGKWRAGVYSDRRHRLEARNLTRSESFRQRPG